MAEPRNPLEDIVENGEAQPVGGDPACWAHLFPFDVDVVDRLLVESPAESEL